MPSRIKNQMPSRIKTKTILSKDTSLLHSTLHWLFTEAQRVQGPGWSLGLDGQVLSFSCALGNLERFEASLSSS